ncbi:hypothetical protein DFH09DRAFT_1067884 [Mycena vulgaris]|nr:hypothetical protein DFH09DRAFT_1067884 [Mycena vulgaris]
MTPEDKENMSKASSGSIHAVHGKDHATGTSHESRPSHTAHSTPRIPSAAKGKGRDYTTAPSIDYSDGYVSEEETADDAARLHQLQADAILAMKLQKQMNSEGHAQEDSMHYTPPVGTSKDTAGWGDPSAAQVKTDHEMARSLQQMFDEQYERIRALNQPSHEDRPAPESSEDLRRRREEAGRRNNAPRAKPTPMEQVPKSSMLFREANDGARSKSKSAPPKNTRKILEEAPKLQEEELEESKED